MYINLLLLNPFNLLNNLDLPAIVEHVDAFFVVVEGGEFFTTDTAEGTGLVSGRSVDYY